jgi:glycosyltransferase involved in cell wall biosynthesis
LVAAQAPRARFLVVGDAPVGNEAVRSRLRALALALDLEGRVLFVGYRADAIELLRCMDVYVSASLWEGLPIALLEAMACGRPVVATDVAGNRDVVVQGQTGLLVPPRDPQHLAAAILAVMRDPGLAARFAQGGRRRVEASFALRATVEATEQLYREVLAGVGGCRLPGVCRERTA